MDNTEPYSQTYEAIFSRGFRSTLRFLLSRGASVNEAEELAQAAWVRGWEARDQLQDAARLVPWINTIAFHRLCGERRRRAKLEELGELADSSSAPVLASVDAAAAIQSCTPMDQRLLSDRFYEGMDMRHIARRHGMSAGAVRVRIHRCLAQLRARLLPAINYQAAGSCIFETDRDRRTSY